MNIITKTRKILAENIVYFRIKNKYSQEKFAELMGTSSVYISQMENGKRNISCDYIDRLAQAFNIEPMELFKNRKVNTRRVDRQNKR